MSPATDSTVTFSYQDQEIEFSLDGTVMINATEMARPFGKLVADFLRLKQTKDFIQALIEPDRQHTYYGNSHNMSVSDVVVSNKKSGTWVHRLLAIKFAAWLHPHFEVWMIRTIERVMYGASLDAAECQRQIAEKTSELEDILSTLALQSPQYRKAVQLQSDIKVLKASYKKLSKAQTTQLLIPYNK